MPTGTEKAAFVAGAAGAIAVACLLYVAVSVGPLACGGALLTPADQSATNTEQDQQMACIKKTPTDAHAISVCRAGVRADWDRYWQKELEGGDAP